MRNGKGKEYYENGNLKFEREYLYSNKIKEKFYVNEKLEYEGEHFSEKRNGKGYDDYCNIIYELKNGNGNIQYNDELKFEGVYLNGLKNGKIKEYDYYGKLEFEGEY